MIQASSKRQGAALMGVLIALAVLSILFVAVTWQNMANRKLVRNRHQQLQSAWLAQSGVETAVARLLKNPAYKGEEAKPMEFSKVKISVLVDKSKENVFQITSEARFPDNEAEAVVRSVTRRYRRIEAGGKIRMEALEPNRSASNGKRTTD
jgi:Tfp pilus assembly protein PilX